jgi:hypothetical protein
MVTPAMNAPIADAPVRFVGVVEFKGGILA